MKGMREVNLELGRPTVSEALQRLEAELRQTRLLRDPVLKIIHGYGSSGTGGKIRTACRRILSEKKRLGQIRDFIPGEDFSIFSAATREAFSSCGALRQDRDLDRYNNGVTFIVL